MQGSPSILTPRKRSLDAVASLCRVAPRLSIAEWAEASCDYSRVPSYDAELKAPWRLDYLPYLAEPMDCLTNPAIRELWILAATRTGKSENFLLTYLRYLLSTCPPYRILYIGGEQRKVEDTFSQRIRRGFGLADSTARLYADAVRLGQVTEHKIEFSACDLVVSWASNRQVAKGDSYPIILADEVSSWPDFKADTLRERQATIAFPKLVAVSSPDAESRRGSDEDPIFQEYAQTDQREHMMPDPKGGEFRWRIGDGTGEGLRWDPKARRDDGSWDIDAVRESAYYLTPGGARIDERDRLDLVRAGKWKATAKGPSHKRGYRIVRMMTPFRSGSFGDMAAAFLSARAKQTRGEFDDKGRPPLRVFFYERCAEKWYSQKVVPEAPAILSRVARYKRGSRMTLAPEYAALYSGRRSLVVMTVDVQKDSFWWTCREWVEGGDSGLVDYGEAAGWKELKEVQLRFNAVKALFDNSYAERSGEVREQLATPQWLGVGIVCLGRDSLKEPFAVKQIDPFEGTSKMGRLKILSITHNPDLLKSHLYRLYSGAEPREWRLPEGLGPEYAEHLTAEDCVDGKWVARRRQNHLLDCEVLQLLAALCLSIYRHVDAPIEQAKPRQESQPNQPQPSQPPPRPRQLVSYE